MLSTYFKERKGFQRVFLLLREKYISLGRFAGTITLDNITKEEAEAFTDFFGKMYHVGDMVKIRFKDIERVLTNTIYKDFSWEELFTNYFDKEIIDRKTQKNREQKDYELFYQEVKNNLTLEEKEFLNQIRDCKSVETILKKRYKKEKRKWQEELSWLIHLIFKLESETPTTLAMFASLTGNPHFLDFKTANFSLFLKLLSIYKNVEEPKTTIDKIELLESVGISIDTISNFCITYGLKSSSTLVSSFYEEKQILNLNLSNLEVIKDLDTHQKYVFVFENPSLLNEFKMLDVPILITSGNANMAVYKILELLEKSHNTIYYNGDFDPEGLLIADKLRKKFSNLELFCYEEEDYFVSKSKEELSESRINKLNRLECKNLEKIKQCLEDNRKSAYQEKNKERIKAFILKVKGNRIEKN